jgi:hypothetical protein
MPRRKTKPPNRRGYRRVWLKAETLAELRQVCRALTVNKCIQLLLEAYRQLKQRDHSKTTKHPETHNGKPDG